MRRVGFVLVGLWLAMGPAAALWAAGSCPTALAARGDGVASLELAQRDLAAARELLQKFGKRTTAASQACASGDCPSAQDLRRLRSHQRNLQRALRELQRRQDEPQLRRRDRSQVRQLQRRSAALRAEVEASLARRRGSKVPTHDFGPAGPASDRKVPTAPAPTRSPAVPPANDACGSAIAIGNGSFSGSTFEATNDGSATCGSSSSSPDVWYRYTASANGTVVFDTFGSAYDTVLSLHSACPGTAANELACNDDSGSLQSRVSLAMTAGQQVLVRVSGYSGSVGSFTLNVELAASISGTVVEDPGGGPLMNIWVDVWDCTGSWVGDAQTDAAGAYTVGGLSTGTHYATAADTVWVGELYDNIPCPGGGWSCEVRAGTPIAVEAASDTPNIDFALALGGLISGTVTDALTTDPLADVTVDIYDATGLWVSAGYTDGTGSYAAGGLPTGTYFAVTSNWLGYVDELYDNIVCEPWCDVTLGTPIDVTQGAETSDVSFGLNQGGSISGTVTTDPGGAPLDVRVTIYDANGSWVNSAWTDGSGSYSVGGLAAGSYFARTWYAVPYVDELYDDIPCVGWSCDVTTGTSIPVTLGAETQNINFGLSQGGSVAGTVTDASTQDPLMNVGVDIYDSNGTYFSYGYTDGAGSYTAGGLPSGSYLALTYNWSGYIDELFDNVPCPGGSCDLTAGTPIAVTVGVQTPGIDFALTLGGSISGTVTDASTVTAIAGVEVDIFDSGGSYVGYGYSDGAGGYSADGLPSGSYFATTYNWSGYIDELYNNFVCEPWCDVTTGTPIAVTVGVDTPNIDFALDPGGSITGLVTVTPGGDPLGNRQVTIYDSGGWWVGSDWTDCQGRYSVAGLAAGTYFARTRYADPYVNELYDNIPCPGWCDVTAGTPIAVASASETPNINFALGLGGSIAGTVTADPGGTPLDWLAVDIYDSTGNAVNYGYTDAAGSYSVGGLPSGNYFARTWNWSGFIDELYDDIPCPGWSCDVTTGTSIPVTQGVETLNIDFGLTLGGSISGMVTDAATDDPLAWIEVDIYNSSGTIIGYGYSDGTGSYTAGGLPSGTCYARTWNWHGYVDELYDDISCAFGCTVTTGTPIPVSQGSDTPNKDFALGQSVFLDSFESGDTSAWSWTYP